jgi:hypothetical protein
MFGQPGLFHARRSIVAAFWLLLVSACHVGLVGDYDENFIKAATELEKEIDGFLQNLEYPPVPTADLTYAGNIGTYNKLRVDLNALLVLARSHERNEPTINQVNALIRIVRGIEDVHKKQGKLSPGFIDSQREELLTAFTSIIRTENDKKAAI